MLRCAVKRTAFAGAFGLVLSFLFAGCASQGFLGFLATTGYVDVRMKEQAAERSRSLSKIEADLDSIEAELASFRETTSELEALIDVVTETQAATEELSALAAEVETRLDTMPSETIATLADILTSYLENGDR